MPECASESATASTPLPITSEGSRGLGCEVAPEIRRAHDPARNARWRSSPVSFPHCVASTTRTLTSPMLESLISGITSAVYTRAGREFYDRHRMSGGQGARPAHRLPRRRQLLRRRALGRPAADLPRRDLARFLPRLRCDPPISPVPELRRTLGRIRLIGHTAAGCGCPGLIDIMGLNRFDCAILVCEPRLRTPSANPVLSPFSQPPCHRRALPLDHGRSSDLGSPSDLAGARRTSTRVTDRNRPLNRRARSSSISAVSKPKLSAVHWSPSPCAQDRISPTAWPRSAPPSMPERSCVPGTQRGTIHLTTAQGHRVDPRASPGHGS
jgi:hypothetical protein